MKLRTDSQVGWMLLSGLGNELVPGIYREELFPPQFPVMHRGRRSGMSAAMAVELAHDVTPQRVGDE